MSAYFFYTSALAKVYHPEIGTPKVVEIVEAIGAQVQISRLTVVELRSVFAIKVRTQAVNREDVSLLLRQFQEDVVSRKFRDGNGATRPCARSPRWKDSPFWTGTSCSRLSPFV